MQANNVTSYKCVMYHLYKFVMSHPSCSSLVEGGEQPYELISQTCMECYHACSMRFTSFLKCLIHKFVRLHLQSRWLIIFQNLATDKNENLPKSVKSGFKILLKWRNFAKSVSH